MSVLAALHLARSGLAAIAKDGKHGANSPGAPKFDYRSADQVINAVSPLFADAGLLLLPSVSFLERVEWENRQEKGGTVTVRRDALASYRVEFSVVSTEDGSSLTGSVISQAQGMTAYSAGAAMSYALKYFLSMLLLIPFEDERMENDADAFGAQRESSRPTRQRASNQEAPQTATGAWWEPLGWEDEETHTEARETIQGLLRGLLPDFLETAKLRLVNWETVDGSRCWVPKNESKPKGPGLLAARIDATTAEAVLDWLSDLSGESARAASGAEPWDGAEPREPVQNPSHRRSPDELSAHEVRVLYGTCTDSLRKVVDELAAEEGISFADLSDADPEGLEMARAILDDGPGELRKRRKAEAQEAQAQEQPPAEPTPPAKKVTKKAAAPRKRATKKAAAQ